MASTSKKSSKRKAAVKAAKAVKTAKPKPKVTSSPKPTAAAKKVKNSTALHNPSKAMRANGWEIIQVWVKPPVKAGLRKQAAATEKKLAEVVRDVLTAAAHKFMGPVVAEQERADKKTVGKKKVSAKPAAKKAGKKKPVAKVASGNEVLVPEDPAVLPDDSNEVGTK